MAHSNYFCVTLENDTEDEETDKETISNSVGSGIQYQRLNSNSGLLENEGDSAQQQNQLQVPLHQINYFTYFKNA